MTKLSAAPRVFDLRDDDYALRGPRLARFFTPSRDQARGRLIERWRHTAKRAAVGRPFLFAPRLAFARLAFAVLKPP